MRSVVRISCLVLICGSIAAVAGAQISTGGIRGFVRDATGGMLPGVTVEAASPARIGGAAMDLTNAQGMYRFENLPVGIYTVTFTMAGFTTVKREGIRVEAGRTIELEQQLTLSTIQETVTVTGEAPVVDASHAGTTTNFNREMLENNTTSRTQYFDIVPYATGASQTSGNVGSNSAFNIFGSDAYQNAIQYDGLDMSAPSFGGSYDWPNYDMMAELQLKSLGASAEQAGFQGGIINLVLKSGSNEFRGTGAFYGAWDPLLANNTPNEQFPRFVKHRLDYNYTFGGPIRKDRIWGLYIAEHIRWIRSDSIGVPADRPNKTRIWRPFIKIDAKLSVTDNLAVHFNDSRDWWEYGTGKTVPPEASHVEVGYDPVVTGRWTHMFGSSTMLEVKGGGIYVRKDYRPVSGDYVTPGHVDLLTGNTTINRAAPTARDNQSKTNINATLAHSASDFIRGTHEFKFGVQTVHWNSASARGAYASNRKLYDLGGAPYYALIQEPYALVGNMPTYGAFAQDDWTVNDRLTLNLGIRYDRVNGDIPEIEQLDGRLESTGKTFPAIKNLIAFNQTSPRLGFALKLDRAGQTVLKSHWGRYYGKLIAGGFWSLSPGNTTLGAFFYNPLTRQYDIPYYTVDPKANFGIDPDLSNQWTDQLFVGIERQIQSSFGVNASFIYKNERNFVRLDDVGGVYAPQAFSDTFEGRTQTLTVFNRVSPSAQSLFQVTNRDDLDQDYKAFVIEANKRFSDRWQMIASYQWQRSLIYASGRMAFQQFGSLGRGGYGRDPNDLINAYGRSPVDSTHGIRFSGTWAAPWGIQLGLRYLYESGRPYGRIVNVPLRQGVRPVLAEGRGAFTLPALHDVRVRLDKDVALGGSRRLRLSLDVINLFNGDTRTIVRNNSSQANFGAMLNVVDPRRAQVGIRVEF